MDLTSSSLAAAYRTIVLSGPAESPAKPVDLDEKVVPVYVRGVVTASAAGGASTAIDRWPVPGSATVREVGSASGDWFGVFSDSSGGYLVANDFFGYRSLCYAVVDVDGRRDWIVGASFQDVRAHLQMMQKGIGLDWPTLTTHAASNHTVFRTRASAATFSSEIRFLPPGAMIQVAASGSALVPRDQYAGPGDRDYEELLEAGIARGAAEIRALLKAHGSRSQFLLSGGKDSRAMLALAFAAGAAKEVGISTESPTSRPPGPARDQIERDFQVACELVGKFGLRWMSRDSVISERMSVSEAVARWQRFRSNNSFQLRGGQSLVGYSDPIVQFIGIGGELFRGYLSGQLVSSQPSWWARAGGTVETTEADLGALFDVLCPRGAIPLEMYSDAKDRFIEAHMIGQEDDVLAALDRGYNAYRNCAHAGTGEYLGSVGITVSRPLAQPEFVWASRLLADEDQNHGRILYDLISRIDPALHEIAYASPPWPERFGGAKAELGGRDRELAAQRGCASLARAMEDERLRGAVLVRDRGVQLADWPSGLQNSFRESLESAMELMADDDRRVWISVLLDRFVGAADFNVDALASALCVSESLRDAMQVHGGPLYSAKLIAGGSSVSGVEFDLVRRTSGALQDIVASAFQRNTLGDFSIELYEVSAGCETPTVELSVKGVPGEFEVAVYWYVDEVKSQTDWYDGLNRIFRYIVGSAARPRKVRAQVFVRRNATLAVEKYVSSNVLEVAS